MERPREMLLSQNESSRVQNRKKARNNFLGIVLIIILWSGMVFGGFYIAKNYIDRAILNVQQTNAMNVQAINERLDTIAADMKNLENIIGTAGQSISSSGNIQKELVERIELFDQQIQELKRSLDILKEAP